MCTTCVYLVLHSNFQTFRKKLVFCKMAFKVIVHQIYSVYCWDAIPDHFFHDRIYLRFSMIFFATLVLYCKSNYWIGGIFRLFWRNYHRRIDTNIDSMYDHDGMIDTFEYRFDIWIYFKNLLNIFSVFFQFGEYFHVLELHVLNDQSSKFTKDVLFRMIWHKPSQRKFR